MTNEQTYVETPRTDAVLKQVLSTGGEIHWGDGKAKQVADFARILERENIALQKQLKDRDNEIQRVKELQILPILAHTSTADGKETEK